MFFKQIMTAIVLAIVTACMEMVTQEFKHSKTRDTAMVKLQTLREILVTLFSTDQDKDDQIVNHLKREKDMLLQIETDTLFKQKDQENGQIQKKELKPKA